MCATYPRSRPWWGGCFVLIAIGSNWNRSGGGPRNLATQSLNLTESVIIWRRWWLNICGIRRFEFFQFCFLLARWFWTWKSLMRSPQLWCLEKTRFQSKVLESAFWRSLGDSNVGSDLEMTALQGLCQCVFIYVTIFCLSFDPLLIFDTYPGIPKVMLYQFQEKNNLFLRPHWQYW